MSEAVNATEAWVKEAKRILAIEATGGSAKDMPTAGEYLKLVDDAFKVVGDGKPAEMSKTDWDSICFTIAAMKQRMLQKNVSSAVSEARKPQNQNKPPLMALWNVAFDFAGA